MTWTVRKGEVWSLLSRLSMLCAVYHCKKGTCAFKGSLAAERVRLHVRTRCGFTGEVSVPTQRGEEDDRVSEHGNRTGVLGAKSCPVFPGELSDVALGVWLALKEGEFVRNGTKAWTQPVMTISAVVPAQGSAAAPGMLPPLRPSALRSRQASGRGNVVFLSVNV